MSFGLPFSVPSCWAPSFCGAFSAALDCAFVLVFSFKVDRHLTWSKALTLVIYVTKEAHYYIAIKLSTLTTQAQTFLVYSHILFILLLIVSSLCPATTLFTTLFIHSVCSFMFLLFIFFIVATQIPSIFVYSARVFIRFTTTFFMVSYFVLFYVYILQCVSCPAKAWMLKSTPHF